jgi:hypothetical protein
MPGVEEPVMGSHSQSSGCTISTTVATLILRPISSQLPDGTGTLSEIPLRNGDEEWGQPDLLDLLALRVKENYAVASVPLFPKMRNRVGHVAPKPPNASPL